MVSKAIAQTDGVSNLAQQSNAQPKQADNDDISSFTDEQEDKAQSNGAAAMANAVPPKAQSATPANKVCSDQDEATFPL